MNISELYKQLDMGTRTVVTDSRCVVSGCIFFALKGDYFDGNNFVEQVIEQGAYRAISDDPRFSGNESIIVVENVLETLQQLAAYHRSLFSIPIIVIGGSNGKTTTKELVISVLSKQYVVAGTKGNLNNHIGVPVTLFSINSDTQIAVIEIGANHIGEHTILCNIVKPTHALVTNNGKDHLEGFGSYQGVCTANQEIYDSLAENGGHAFVCSSHSELLAGTEKLDRTTYGLSGNETYSFSKHIEDGYAGILYNGEIIQSQLVGELNVENIAAAASIGLSFDVSVENIISAVSSYQPSMLRSQVVKYNNGRWVIDCYNANPTSMELGIRDFVSELSHPSALILGDMFELGQYAEQEHINIVSIIIDLSVDKCILIGPEFKKAFSNNSESIIAFGSSDEAKEYINQQDWNGYSVFVKGSRGMKLEGILPFSLKK